MPVRFVLDENLRGKPIWHALRRSFVAGPVAIDTVRVGDPPDLPLGSTDPSILIWAQAQDRILISGDVQTLPLYLAQHLRRAEITRHLRDPSRRDTQSHPAMA